MSGKGKNQWFRYNLSWYWTGTIEWKRWTIRDNNVESSWIEVSASDIESNIDEVIEARKFDSDYTNEEDPKSSRNEQKSNNQTRMP